MSRLYNTVTLDGQEEAGVSDLEDGQVVNVGRVLEVDVDFDDVILFVLLFLHGLRVERADVDEDLASKFVTEI